MDSTDCGRSPSSPSDDILYEVSKELHLEGLFLTEKREVIRENLLGELDVRKEEILLKYKELEYDLNINSDKVNKKLSKSVCKSSMRGDVLLSGVVLDENTFDPLLAHHVEEPIRDSERKFG